MAHMLDLLTGSEYPGTHVSQMLYDYNEYGPASIRDRRHDNPGRALALISAEQEEQWRGALVAVATGDNHGL